MPAVKYKKNCKACMLSKTDPKVRKRIRYAAFKREAGDETLVDIAISTGLNHAALYNHVKKHVTDVQDLYAAAKEIKIAKKSIQLKAQAAQELQLSVSVDTIDSVEGRPQEIIALDDYIGQAKALIDRGNLKINATSFLQAVKIRTDWSSKQQTNKTEFMKAIYAMSSGDKQKKVSTDGQRPNTQEDAGSSDTGKEEPQTVYGAITGPDTP